MAPPGSAAGRGADGDGPTTLAAADSKDSSTPQQPNDQSLTQTDNNDANYYDRSSFLPADASGKLMPQDLLRLHCSFGFDSNKRANLHLMDESTLLTSVGNVLVLINLKTMEQTYHQGVRDGGVGAIAVHPTRKYIAVAEVYFAAPAIFIFEYPTMEIVRVLRAGATKGYSNVCFNATGSKLASVGTDPDYMLTMWDWANESVILRSKAFSQDVFKVAFAADSDGNLTTSGMGHIKFWRMASTFTGLKLQGYLGKFGASELTDISAFIQLPDGKVLSSTETGNLLLWDGGLIKCELSDKGRKPCHAGRIDVILMVDNEVYTAGEDGYVRVWDFETIDNADVTSPAAGSGGGDGTGGAPVSSSGPLQVRVFEMEFLDEFLIGKDAKIRTMVRSLENPTEYYIQDTQGHLLKLDTNKRTVDRLLSFHSGAVVAADASPLRHSLLSLGSDGTLRLYDYQNKAVLFRQRFPCGGSSLTYLPDLLDVRGLTFAAGFSDGVLRIMSHEAIYDATNVELKLHYAFKPHKGSVSSIAISSDGGYLATTGAEDRCVFFFRLEPAAGNASEDDAFTSGDGQQQPLVFGRGAVSVTPLGFVELEASATCVSFSPDNHLYLQDFEPAAAGTGSDDSGDGGSGGGSQRSSRVDRSDLGSEEGSRDSEGGGEGRRGRDAEPEIDGKRTMVVLSDGLMLSMVVPSSNDSRVTYQLELESLQVKRWQLKVPPPPKEEEKGDAANGSDGKATSGGDGSPAAAAQSAPPPATAAGAAAGPAEDGKGEKDNPSRLMSALRRKRGLVIVDESPVTLALYLEGGYFLVALVNKFGEGEIRSCKFDDPTMSRLLLVYKAPFTDLRLTASGKYLLAGTLDGMTFLRKIRLEDMLLHGWTLGHETYEHYSISFEEQLAEKELQKRAVIESSSAQQETTGTAAPRVMSTAGPNRDEEAGQYWYGHAHDCDRGRVNSLVTSFDDAFLCSAGSDGGLFVWRLTHVDVQESQAFEATAGEKDEGVVEDIVESSSYTLQETKVKAEKDRELEEAERKKQLTRNYISELRSEFLKAVAELEAVDPKFDRKSIQVDPNLRSDIEKKTKERIETLQKELAWISEKESIGPNKLKKKFLDVLQTESIEINAFKSGLSVATFRTLKLDEDDETALKSLVGSRGGPKVGLMDGNNESTQESAENNDENVRAGQGGDGATQVKKAAKHANDSRSKLEARKALRAERTHQFKALLELKPDESYEDPRDVAAIKYAETHMGDYKLKSGENYVVSEVDRIDADKKKRQILLLKESVFNLKEQFNLQILSLRDKKQALIDFIVRSNEAVTQIEGELRKLDVESTHTLWTPTMEATAYPERRYIVTAEDVAELQREGEAMAAKARNGDGDMMGGFGSGGTKEKEKEAPAVAVSVSAAEKPEAKVEGRVDGASRPTTATSRKTPSIQGLSPLERTERDVKVKVLQFRKSRILKMIADCMKEFDASVEALLKERMSLDADLKMADMQLLVLYREWCFLKEFETHDNALVDKIALKRIEKKDSDMKIKECQDRLNAKKSEIELVIRKEREIQEEFERTLGENNKYEEMLTKIFKKKIKRQKKKLRDTKENGQDDEDEEEMEDESDEDDEDDSDDDGSSTSSGGGKAEKCPSDLDPALFAKVLDLRELKLDQEDVIAEIQKAIDALKKEHDGLLKKEKTIDLALKGAEADIQEFQNQKQKKLNELDVVVPLRFHQIQHLERNAMPASLSQTIVFLNSGLAKLRNRIKELHQEKADIRKQHKELRKMHVALNKSRKEKQAKLAELDNRATDVQMLKFGHVIDLEKLERMGINKTADELREKLQREDARQIKELQQWEAKVNSMKETLTKATKQNTLLLERLVSLTQSKHSLEESLNNSQKSVNAEFSGPLRKDIIERDKLIELVQAQASQIDGLKREIEMLIRKPVRALPPIRGRQQSRPGASAAAAAEGAEGDRGGGRRPVGGGAGAAAAMPMAGVSEEEGAGHGSDGVGEDEAAAIAALEVGEVGRGGGSD